MCEQSCSVESVLLNMQTSLACTICLDLLSNPLTTKCGHTFCKLCLDRIQIGSKNSFPCPLCLTVITKRAVSENAKITALVLAVRNVIASIKEDCGFQEPIRNISATSQIESVKEDIIEEDAPIRRTTRHMKPISYYADEVFPIGSKRKSTKKTKDQEELIPTESIVHIEDKKTESISINLVQTRPTEVTDLSIPVICSKPQISKVEQWLTKNESINFGNDDKLDLEEDLIATQVFSKPLDIQCDSGRNINDVSSKDDYAETMCSVSQTSTVIFNEDTLQKDSELKTLNGKSRNEKDMDEELSKEEKDMDEELSKEETNSMMSEKENEKMTTSVSLQNQNETRRGRKRILFEPNKMDNKKVNKENLKNIPVNDKKEESQTKEIKIPSQFLDLQKSFQKDHLDKCLGIGDDAHSSITGHLESKSDSKKIEHSQHPNKKGHNIRFASTINLKSVEKTKPAQLLTKGKTKKSPGWSRIEGARHDLRSKHTSLNIRGGEQRVNLDSSKLELSKLNVESSQESVVVIEEDYSQTNPSKSALLKRQRKFPNSLSKITKFKPVNNKLLYNKITTKVNLTSGSINNLSKDIKEVTSKEVKNGVGKTKVIDIVNSQCSGKVETVYKNTSKISDKLGNKSDTLSSKNEELCDKNHPDNTQVTSLHILHSEKELNHNSDLKDVCEEVCYKENYTYLLSCEKVCNYQNTVPESKVCSIQITVPENKICSNQITVPENKVSNNKITVLENNTTPSKYKRPILGRSRLSRKNTVASSFITNEKLSLHEKTPSLKSKKLKSDVNKDGDNGAIRLKDKKDSLKESKLNTKENSRENIVVIEEQGTTNGMDSKPVPFQIHGSVGENSKFHHSHSVPCELFHMLVKYSAFLSEEYQKSPCPNYNEHKFLKEEAVSTCEKITKPSETDASSPNKVSNQQKISTDSSAVPDSCIEEYEREVAIILPDSVPGTSLKFKDNLTVNLKKLNLSVNAMEIESCEDELNQPDALDLKEEGYEGSQSSQLSASILQSGNNCTTLDHADNKAVAILELEMPPEDELEFKDVTSNADTQHLSQICNKNLESVEKSCLKSYFDIQDLEIREPISQISNDELPKSLSQTSQTLSTLLKSSSKGESDQPINVLTQVSGDQLTKKSSEESPITFKKRSKRTQRIDSSSSSSEEELPDLVGSQKKLCPQNQGFPPPEKKPRLQVHGSSPSQMKTYFQVLSSPPSRQLQDSPPPLPSSPQVDSEELRDFERYDENVWNYYNSKLNQKKNDDIESNAKGKVNEGKTCSKRATHIDDSDEDDVIPGTEEVLKNIDDDIVPTKEREAQEKTKKANTSLCESFRGTIDLFSQDSVKTTSSFGLNSSVKEMFNKCNQTLNICSKVLNASQLSQDLEKPTKNVSSTSKLNVDNKASSVAAYREGEETVEDFSGLSAESPVLCTQQRNKVEGEVETLRNKIRSLEAEMNRKEAALNESKTGSKVVENGQDEEPPSVTLDEERTEEFERDSDLDSEELFKSAPAETLFQRGVTLRNGRSLGAANKVIKKMVPITLICTGLSPSEISMVHKFASSLCGLDGKVVSGWSEEVTHVVVKTDDEGMTERTLKYLLGVASGVWIVSVEWVTDSLRANILLPEDEYEALDCTGAPGPSRGRRVTTPIFRGFQFCLIPPFVEVSIDQLQDLIKTCCGSIVKSFNEENPGPKLYIVNSEDPEKENEVSNIEKRNKVTVGHDWIIECIGMHSLVSLLNYMIGVPTAAEISASGIPESLIHETQELV